MQHEFQYTFGVPFLRTALRRDHLWRGYVAGALLLLLPVAARLLLGQWTPSMIVVAVVAGGFVSWRGHRRLEGLAETTAELWTTQSPSGVVRFVLDDDGFEVRMDRSHARYAWSDLRRLWRYDDVWMIEVVKMQSVFFPPDCAQPEAMDFLAERCRAAGVKVKP